MNQTYNRFGRAIATKNRLLNFYEYECPECNGEGSVDIGPICFRPASDCCGGCYQEHSCEICDGNGTIDLDNGYLWRLYDILIRLEIRKHTTQKTHDMICHLINQELLP